MAEADFNALLDKPMDEVEPPKPQAKGSYIWSVTERNYGKSTDKQTPYVEFKVSPIQALQDVDADELAAFLGDEALNEQEKKITFYITKDALYRLTEFLGHCGIAAEGKPIRQAIEEVLGANFVGMVTHTPSKTDPNKVFANISQTAAVPA